MASILLGLIAVTALVVPLATAAKGGGKGDQQQTLPTSLEDYMAPGTQPNPDSTEFRRIVSSANCMFCHADYGLETPPYDTWVVSLMAQSARDPVFHAAFTIANQDADKAGAFCIRCHIPAAHYGGQGDSSEIPDFDVELMDGINCHFCHRVTSPTVGVQEAKVQPHAAAFAVPGGKFVSALVDDSDIEVLTVEGELHIAGITEHLLGPRVGGFDSLVGEAVVVRVHAGRFLDGIKDPGVSTRERVGADIRTFKEGGPFVETASTANLRWHVAVLATGDGGIIGKRAAETTVFEDHAAIGEITVEPLGVGSLLRDHVIDVVGGVFRSHHRELAFASFFVEDEDGIAHIVTTAAEGAVAMEWRRDDSDLLTGFVVSVIVGRNIVVGSTADVVRIDDILAVADGDG